MEEAFIALLLADPGISALVGTRINWSGYPQGTTNPAAALYKIDAIPGYTMTGEDGLTQSRVQIDVRDTDYSRAVATARAIRAKLSGFVGTQGSINFTGIFMLSERQSSEKPSTELFHRISMDFQVNHSSL